MNDIVPVLLKLSQNWLTLFFFSFKFSFFLLLNLDVNQKMQSDIRTLMRMVTVSDLQTSKSCCTSVFAYRTIYHICFVISTSAGLIY